jgi:CBS domain-containing protein
VPCSAVEQLTAVSPPFADVLNRRMQAFLELSRRSIQTAYASQNLAAQALERPLASLGSPALEHCTPETPIERALRAMQERRIGSIIVRDNNGVGLGILTRHDILDRITLPRLALDTPISTVMSRPLHTLPETAPAQAAALLMTRHGIRHVPFTRDGRVVGIVSERDLFSIQRLSIRDLSASIDAAPDIETMATLASEVRRFAANLLGQGVQATPLTELISQLNDRLTARIVHLIAIKHERPLERMCWLALGSEGRGEQTIATDQDNGLIFESENPQRDRSGWIAFARAVNEALAACGFPLCPGNVMASNPECCLTVGEWEQRFSRWIDQGTPEHLLAASIYFDLRPIAGREEMVHALRELIRCKVASTPRFCKLLATEVLRTPPPLDWLGRIETEQGGFDLKRLGSGVLVAVARLRALEKGVSEVNTLKRMAAVADIRETPIQRSEAVKTAFEFLQMLRLRVQMPDSTYGVADSNNPNLLAVDRLNDIDRRILKETLRVVMNQQKDLELDYGR